ncbi:MAG: PQQ-binding-like beta-propeller repeat protein [Ignavibacteriales bacterium]|nr:PQQ-binding-like beta-propeller repeat protein [Ignavibacteriales bacterium]
MIEFIYKIIHFFNCRIIKSLIPLVVISISFSFGCFKSIIISDSKYDSPAYPMFGKNPARNFFVPLTITDSLKLLWENGINGSLNSSSLVFQGDYLFVSDLSGRIYAFNLMSGKEIGYLNYKGFIVASPIINQLKIIFAVTIPKENKSVIYNYDFRTGKEVSKIEVDGRILTDMIELDDGIIFTTEQGKVYRYHFNSTKKWEYDNNCFIHSSSAANNKTFVFGDDKGNVTALNLNDGNLVFKKKISSGFESGFAVSGDTVYVGDNSGNLFSFDINTGTKFWEFKSGASIKNYLVMNEQFIFVGNLKGEIYKLNKNDGRLIWETKTGGLFNTTPLLFNNRLLLTDLNKKILMIDVESGKIVKSIPFEEKPVLSPMFFNNIIFFGTDEGQIFAYEIVH